MRTHEHIFLRKQIRYEVTLAHSTFYSFCDFAIYPITIHLKNILVSIQVKLSEFYGIMSIATEKNRIMTTTWLPVAKVASGNY